MKLSAIKAEGYDGLMIYCAHCRRKTQVTFSQLPDGEFTDIAGKLICSKCNQRPAQVTTYRDETRSMLY